jgi:DNA-binding CsgD family transcriptional regulator
MYVECLNPQGITSVLCSGISFRGRASSLLCLNRHKRGTGFRTRDLERLRAALVVIGVADAAAQSRLAESSRILATGGLSPREKEVARLIRAGLQNKEIAAFLGTSLETVRKQTIRVYDKLGVSGRVQLVLKTTGST